MKRSRLVPAALLALVGGVCPSRAQSDDPVVTSDTSAYCEELVARLKGMTPTAAPGPPTEVAVLSEEGERMCLNGQFRGGVMRLRRAIALMRHAEEEE